MSSLRNAVKRREYKERSQPKARRHLGLLEKHKDYVQRAQDYNRKKARLQRLREKAATRNPEEFYFGMVKAKTKDGVHELDNARPAVPTRTMRTFKAQDASYLKAKGTAEARRVERLRASLHRFDEEAQSTHTLFVDDDTDVEHFDVAAHFDTMPELAGRRFNRLRKADLAAKDVQLPKRVKDAIGEDPEMAEQWMEGVHRQRKAAYRELEQRTQRAQKIAEQAAELEEQRALMGKGARKKRKVPPTASNGDVGAQARKKAVFRFKPERKR